MRWESKQYIEKQEPVSDDPNVLREQITNLAEFEQAVADMRPEVEYVGQQSKAVLYTYGAETRSLR